LNKLIQTAISPCITSLSGLLQEFRRMKEFRNIWVGRSKRSFLHSLARSLKEYIENVRKVRRAPSASIDLPTSASHEKENGGWHRRGPRHATVAHVLDRGSTGLRSSRGSYVPFCINRETPRRTRTSGRFWNRLNPPASCDHEGMKVPEVPKALDISPLFLLFFLTTRGEKYVQKCWDGIPSFRLTKIMQSLNDAIIDNSLTINR